MLRDVYSVDDKLTQKATSVVYILYVVVYVNILATKTYYYCVVIQ